MSNMQHGKPKTEPKLELKLELKLRPRHQVWQSIFK